MKKIINKDYIKFVIIIMLIGIIVFLLKKYGVFNCLSITNIRKLKIVIGSFGIIAPLIYICIYIVACIVFLPGLPITVLGAIVFGPIMGAIWTLIGATLGASLAFLIGRYAGRGMVEKWVKGKEEFEKIDEGVRKQGWRMLMITRLVPVFPFNLQNFAYGLTKIDFKTYVFVSAISMIPGIIAFTFMAGAIVSGEGIGKISVYIGIGAIFFVIISLIPKWIKK